MELGGVGSPAGCGFVGRDLAATAAKLSLPVQKALLRDLGMSTEVVMPARAMAMLEWCWWLLLIVLLVVTGAISNDRLGRYDSLYLNSSESDKCQLYDEVNRCDRDEDMLCDGVLLLTLNRSG